MGEKAQTEKKLKGWQQIVSGGAAGLISRMIIAPLDVIKIRYQVSTGVWSFDDECVVADKSQTLDYASFSDLRTD